MPIPTIEQQKRFEKKIAFFAERLNTCRYRFYNMIQNRKKVIPQLHNNYTDQNIQQQVESTLLNTADTYINCLRGEYYSRDIPDYLQKEANAFKRIYFTDLAPQFVLEEERNKVLGKIFEETYAK